MASSNFDIEKLLHDISELHSQKLQLDLNATSAIPLHSKSKPLVASTAVPVRAFRPRSSKNLKPTAAQLLREPISTTHNPLSQQSRPALKHGQPPTVSVVKCSVPPTINDSKRSVLVNSKLPSKLDISNYDQWNVADLPASFKVAFWRTTRDRHSSTAPKKCNNIAAFSTLLNGPAPPSVPRGTAIRPPSHPLTAPRSDRPIPEAHSFAEKGLQTIPEKETRGVATDRSVKSTAIGLSPGDIPRPHTIDTAAQSQFDEDIAKKRHSATQADPFEFVRVVQLRPRPTGDDDGGYVPTNRVRMVGGGGGRRVASDVAIDREEYERLLAKHTEQLEQKVKGWLTETLLARMLTNPALAGATTTERARGGPEVVVVQATPVPTQPQTATGDASRQRDDDSEEEEEEVLRRITKEALTEHIAKLMAEIEKERREKQRKEQEERERRAQEEREREKEREREREKERERERREHEIQMQLLSRSVVAQDAATKGLSITLHGSNLFLTKDGLVGQSDSSAVAQPPPSAAAASAPVITTDSVAVQTPAVTRSIAVQSSVPVDAEIQVGGNGPRDTGVQTKFTEKSDSGEERYEEHQPSLQDRAIQAAVLVDTATAIAGEDVEDELKREEEKERLKMAEEEGIMQHDLLENTSTSFALSTAEESELSEGELAQGFFFSEGETIAVPTMRNGRVIPVYVPVERLNVDKLLEKVEAEFEQHKRQRRTQREHVDDDDEQSTPVDEPSVDPAQQEEVSDGEVVVPPVVLTYGPNSSGSMKQESVGATQQTVARLFTPSSRDTAGEMSEGELGVSMEIGEVRR